MRTGTAIAEVPASEAHAVEGTTADLAERRKFLAAQMADIEAKLTAGKEPELGRLTKQVEDFNAVFGTRYSLSETPEAKPAKPARLCGNCKLSGHNKKNCPTKGAAA